MTTIQSLFDTAIDLWMKNDPRGEVEVQNYLKQLKKDYDALPADEKKYYNEDHLVNPYHDSTIYYATDKNKPVKKIIVWIDVEWPEMLLVHEMNKGWAEIDLVVWHHPEWSALLWIAKLQKGIAPAVAHNTGVPINQCEYIEFPRVWEVEKRFSPLNHSRAMSFAKYLDIPYVWVHTPADNCCHKYFEALLEKNKNSLFVLQDIVDMLMLEPEMQIARNNASGPQIWNGEKTSKCGKIVVTGITWGTESSKSIYAEYAKAWVGTILEMHMSADHLAEAKKNNINVIMTDHMASDSLWMNLIFDKMEKEWVEILDFSWFTRYSRN